MLDKWEDDVISALKHLRKIEGRSLQPGDCLVANNTMLSLMQSFVWNGQFEGVQLNVRLDASGYSWIDIPSYFDPLAELGDGRLEIRSRTKIETLCHFFRGNYSEYDDDTREPWPTKMNAKYETFDSSIPCPETEAVKTHLRGMNCYYAMLLSEDPKENETIKRDLTNISYQILEDGEGQDFERMTHMGYQGHTKLIFGHRYFSHNDRNRTYVVATNPLGPIGIMSLYDYAKKSGEDHNPDKISISFVSVSPGYRQLGIAKNLLRKAAEYAVSTQRYITRTEPSTIGAMTSYAAYTALMRKEFPKLPFVGHLDADYLHQIEKLEGFRGLSYIAKCMVIQEAVASIQKMFPESVNRRRYESIDLTEIVTQASRRVSRFSQSQRDRSLMITQMTPDA